jgi:MATE family multidrug resistance protein
MLETATAQRRPQPTLVSVLALALPIMLANATTPLVGFVDAVVVGQIGEAAPIGGVAMGATVFNAIYWFFAFLRMGTTAFSAQALGADDRLEIAATLIRALGLAAGIGLVVVAGQSPIRGAFLAFLGGSAEVKDAMRAYFDWRIWAAPAGLINFAILGWLIGLGRTVTALVLQLVLNAANIILAIGLALGLGHGVAGVGQAALIAEWIAAFLGLLVAWRLIDGGAALRLPRAMLLDPVKLRAMVAVNRDLMIRTFCVLMAAQMFVRIGAGQGDAVLAANALLINLLYLTYYLLDGYANAAETLVGQAKGAADRDGLHRSVRLCTLAAGVTSLALTVLIALAGPAVIAVMTPNPDVQAIALRFLPWAAIMPVVAVWCFMLDGVYVGATWTADMRNLMVASFAVYLATLASLVPAFGNDGLWAAHAMFFIVRALTLGWRYPTLAAMVR